MIASNKDLHEVVVLPEMFATGFSMKPELMAETMNGSSVAWMKRMAAQYRCIITGSLMIEEEGKYYNRLVWMQPDGICGHYDKRHLFAFAGEDQHYTNGSKRFIASVKGWKICLMVCYDLRFPVWLRNQNEEYDVLIVVANWPERRSLAWRTLLQARAIENQSYTVGVNRVGDDIHVHYNGDSSVFAPLGETIWQQSNDACVHTVTLNKEALQQVRNDLPFLKDADRFVIL
jgi:predicted amidohydrolase